MQCVFVQGFGGNQLREYAAQGLLGHTGIDDRCGFGTPIKSPFDGFVYKVLTVDKPANDGSGFTGVFMIVDDGIECFEWLEGHCNPTVAPYTQVKKGDVIGTEANHGGVYYGNLRITLAMQQAGDQRGNHRHSQKRAIMPVAKTTRFGSFLSGQTSSPYYDGEHYYQVIDPTNGYAGCVNPLAPLFNRSLYIGASGYDVFCLQRFLAREGHFTVEPTAFFGVKTAAAVVAYQTANGITPNLGYFGPITRTSVLRKLNWQPYFGPVQ